MNFSGDERVFTFSIKSDILIAMAASLSCDELTSNFIPFIPAVSEGKYLRNFLKWGGYSSFAHIKHIEENYFMFIITVPIVVLC